MSSEATSSINADGQNKVAMAYMLLAVLLFSTLPIAFTLGGANNAPFLFVAVVCLFVAVSNVGYLLCVYSSRINRDTFKQIRRNFIHPALLWTTLAQIDYVIFAFALSYVNQAVAAVLIETSPIFMIIFMALLFKKEQRYEKITVEKWFLFAVAFIGVAFVVLSQNETVDTTIQFSTYSEVGGILLIIIASLLGAVGVPATQRWGLAVSNVVGDDKRKDEVFFAIIASTIGRALSGICFIILGLLLGENIQSIGGFGVSIAIVYGLFGLGLATVFLRIANIKTTNLSINAVGYAIPAVALIWLAFASLINVPHVDWLIIGVAAIIAANLLLNFKVEIRAAYKALIIALWICGTSVYLHTSFPLPDYVEIVGVIATLFILILAFRVDRLVRRTTEEESNEFFLFRRLTALVESGGINDDAPNQLREIGKHVKPSALRDAYGKLMQYFVEARKHHSEGNHDMLSELEARVDTLTHSKQQGANFGELTALGFMGFIMVSALLLFKPVELSGWEGLFVETSSFLLATAIVFLFANIFDLQHDRTNAILTKEKGKKYYSVAFDDAGDRGSERWISITVCIAITVAYIWLFLGKWIF